MLYIYVNRSLKKYLQLYKGSDAPRHLFSTILINLTYFMIYIMYYLTSGFIATIIMAFIYSLYISDLSYSFIDNSGYNFKNPITFYNSNYIFFCVLGTIYSFIEYFYLLHYDLEIVGLFIYILCSTLLFAAGNVKAGIKLYIWAFNVVLVIIYQLCILLEWYKNVR
mgnify:CR=1 FL=1